MIYVESAVNLICRSFILSRGREAKKMLFVLAPGDLGACFQYPVDVKMASCFVAVTRRVLRIIPFHFDLPV